MSAESRRTAAAFDALVQTLTAVGREIDGLVDRAAMMRDAVQSGVVLSEFVTTEDRPLIITRMTELLDRMSDAAAEVRRAEAHQLRAEGLSHERIAQLFGVTRQRAAALLAPPPGPHARAAKRPQRRDG
jgi:glycine cleavage system regulatory protein